MVPVYKGVVNGESRDSVMARTARFESEKAAEPRLVQADLDALITRPVQDTG